MDEIRGIPLLHMKTMAPVVRKNMVHRQALVDRIEEGIEQGFVLVSAPPGYGKTTLVADWARNSHSPVAWLTLDANDNDLLTFYRYARELFQQLTPSGELLKGNLQFESDTHLVLHAMLSEFINNRSDSSVDFSLVLDDYQVIENRELHDAVFYLLSHFPEHFRLIIITRSDPPFSLSRLRANHKILELRADDLAFSMTDTQQFLNEIKHLNLSEEEIDRIHQKTEGWITGLQLASLTRDESVVINDPGVALTSSAILTLDYMVDEVIELQSDDVQNFLLRTSILNNLYGPLCDYMLAPFGGMESQSLLHKLYHANLFLTSMDENEHWFRYHSLFAEALRHLLAERLPEDIPILCARASEWCERHGYYDAALNYAFQTCNKDLIIPILERTSYKAFMQNRILDILGRIRNTDESILAASPVLCMIYSWGCLFSFDIETGEIWLNRASSLMENLPAGSHLKLIENEIWGLIAVGKSILAATECDMNKAMELSRQALRLLPEENEFTHCLALLNQGMALSINGKLNKAIRILIETVHASEKSSNWFVMMLARINLAEILIDNGQFSRAMTICEQSIEFFSKLPGELSVFTSMFHKQIADIYMSRNQLAESMRSMQESMRLSAITIPSYNDFDTHLRMARVYHSQGDSQRTRDEISLARQLSITSQARLDDLILNVNEAKWSLQRGQAQPAARLVHLLGFDERTTFKDLRSIPFTVADNILILIARLNITEGRSTNNHDKIAIAIDELNVLLPILLEAGMVEHLIEVNVLLALAYHELGRTDEMLAAIHTALKSSELEEVRQVFLDEGIPMSRVLIHYLGAQKQGKFEEDRPGRFFVTDLLFRITGKETDLENDARQTDAEVVSEVVVTDLLTARESEVLDLVSRGCSNNEIAARLHLSINTVKRHLNNAYMKLGATTRTQAVRVARQQGLIK